MEPALPDRAMTNGPAHLATHDLTKRFGALTALDALTLDIKEGEFVCLVGPSGCGKTTALRIIAGLEAPSSGRIESNGRDITVAAPSERRMGMVFQSYALFPNMSAAQNIAFALARGTTSRERKARVAELLKIVDLGSLAERRPHEMSGGQQQRVAIARALATAPQILLLDEPLSALDPHIRTRLRNELKSLQRRLGITTLMVTHDQGEALAIADRIAVMRAGKLLQIGSPRAVYATPADPFTGTFVGAMNLLPAKAESANAVRILGRLTVEVNHGFANGTTLFAAIRPEGVEVVTERSPANDAIAATVQTREFLGAFVRLSLFVDGLEPPVLADVPAAHPLASEGADAAFRLPAARLQLFATAS
jgi:iron(III) transport system ATP-binding protein